MNRIEKLIKEKCPTGVEYKALKDVCLEKFWIMPSTPRYQVTGIPYITSKNIRNGKIFLEDVKYITVEDYKNISSNRPILENDFLISMIGTIGEVGIVKKEELPFYGQNMYLLRLNIGIINIRFFYHYFTSKKIQSILLGKKNNGNQGYLKTKNLESLMIPCPPLDIQEEIVKILDKFGELEIELETELELRKKQYKFWCGTLINRDTRKYKLHEIASIYDGTHSTPNYQSSGIPFVSVENINDIYNSNKFISKKDYDKYKIKPKLNDVFMTRMGSIGKCFVFEKEVDVAYYVSLALIRPNNDIIISKYLKYYLESYVGQEELNKKTLVHAVPIKINKDDIGKINILVPSKNEQQKIVNILDKFEKLIYDISEGLPAEMELRRKQYEYYREKLLSFEEI